MLKYDVVIVGGGPAGLAAALVLGLARRRVAVFDAGQPRNAPSRQAHGFLTRDGISPPELLHVARQQMTPYPSVEFHHKRVEKITSRQLDFEVVTDDHNVLITRRILFATGLVDDLPPIKGVREMWGVSVLHCPYCHGWEVRDQPLAVYANGDACVEFCAMIKGWSDDLVICTDGAAEFGSEPRRLLVDNDVQVCEDKISRLEGEDGQLTHIVFENGDRLARTAMFIHSEQRQASLLPELLGCNLDENGLVATDQFGRTSIRGVFVAGDIGRHGGHNITSAAYSGSSAAMALNRDLLGEDFGLDMSPQCDQL